jgi:NAD(P)-dependent dehydrogenase (short-subunit alcohol dehydrogenase family)
LPNVLVTGASRGIGLAIAGRLAASGFTVIALARTQGEALTAAIEAASGQIVFAPFDLTRIDAIPDMVRDLKAAHGPLYGLVNNAGLGSEGLLANTHNSQIEAVIQLNVTAPIVLTKYVVRGMMAGGGGRIINISSIIGETGNIGQANYAASKSGLFGLTKTLAREAAHQLGRAGKLTDDGIGVTINTVAPGFVATEMLESIPEKVLDKIKAQIPLGRLARPDEIARVVHFLAADQSSYITGAVWGVNGGQDM